MIQLCSESFSTEIRDPSYIFSESTSFRAVISISDMARTRGGSRVQPRVRFSTPERETAAPVPAPVPSPVPEAVPDKPLGFRRYQTRMGPRAPSPVPGRRARRARPSKRARTSGPGESSSARPPSSPVVSPTEVTSSPQLSPASRIRRPMFVGHLIPGNAGLHSRPFQQESFYDVPGLRADPRYRESMRLIEEYSLLPFMTPRQFYYPRVVRQFYHSMTSKEADGPLEIHFRIDDRRGVLSPAVISAALRLRNRRAMRRVTEIEPTHLTERWFEHWPEMLQLVQYFIGGSFRLICCSSTIFYVPACSLSSIMCRGGDPSWRRCTGSRAIFGSAHPS